MDTLVLSTLLFNTVGIVVIAVAAVAAYCLPRRRQVNGN
jgi:hypothetical protein